MKRKWHTITCAACGGAGMVSEYTCGGDDFLGPKECDCCGGSGEQWVSPQGRIADYPGGPFRGRATEKELAGLSKAHEEKP
ncbi:MAG: hypothetical protein IMZ62_17280 [Chloroflexi bacterium]|nr:hypothetical protein [Chloroflexota bacterium]